MHEEEDLETDVFANLPEHQRTRTIDLSGCADASYRRCRRGGFAFQS
jgi:hypothetical protein